MRMIIQKTINIKRQKSNTKGRGKKKHSKDPLSFQLCLLLNTDQAILLLINYFLVNLPHVNPYP